MIDIKSALKALAIAFDNYCKANNINAELSRLVALLGMNFVFLICIDVAKLTPTK